MAEHKVVLIPDGLEGERVDAAIARLLGLSRTRIGDLISAGRVSLNGASVAKSDRVSSGEMLEVELDSRPDQAVVVPLLVPGLRIVHDDDDIVVVDKPVGVAAHPSPGWTGPTVIGGLAAMGQRVATSGAAERQGVVHRLDVGTTGVMVVAKSELAYSALKRAFRSARSTSATTRWCRATSTRCAGRSTRLSTGTRPPTTGTP
jgi:23S rRNA pseudouridine1911/1915/1917 synthase